MLHFGWDPEKNKDNKRKHHVSFEEASSVFADTFAKLIPDPDHSEGEDRFVLLGLSQNLRTLVVCHCYRKSGGVIRIISARKATRQEQRLYLEGLR